MTRKPQLSDESLVFLIHSTLVFSGVKKENRYIHCGMSLKVIGSWFVRISVLFGLGLVVVYCLNFQLLVVSFCIYLKLFNLWTWPMAFSFPL